MGKDNNSKKQETIKVNESIDWVGFSKEQSKTNPTKDSISSMNSKKANENSGGNKNDRSSRSD